MDTLSQAHVRVDDPRRRASFLTQEIRLMSCHGVVRNVREKWRGGVAYSCVPFPNVNTILKIAAILCMTPPFSPSVGRLLLDGTLPCSNKKRTQLPLSRMSIMRRWRSTEKIGISRVARSSPTVPLNGRIYELKGSVRPTHGTVWPLSSAVFIGREMCMGRTHV